MNTTSDPVAPERRYVGIHHRIKRNAEGEARPTKVALCNLNGGVPVPAIIEIEDEQGELDFLHARLPVHWSNVDPQGFDGDISKHPQHHWTSRKLKEGEENHEQFPPALVFQMPKEKKAWHIITKLPDQWEGLRKGDIVLMLLGGSGDYLAYAASIKCAQVGAEIFRCQPSALKEFRESKGDTDTSNDAFRIVQFYLEKPDAFYPVTAKEANMIVAREKFRARQALQQDRKACHLRLLSQAIGVVFINPEGLYPQGSIEREYDRLAATDTIFAALMQREKQLDREIAKALEAIPIYGSLFKPIEGVGPIIAAGILTVIGDIRRFVCLGKDLEHRSGKLKKFCGIVPRPDGSFPRKRGGEILGYNPDIRQSLFLLGDQFNRRPGSVWGAKLLAEKKRLREREPYQVVETTDGKKHQLVPGKFEKKKGGKYLITLEGGERVEVTGKLRYYDGHILRMAIWSTLRQFVEHLYDEWTKLEGVGEYANDSGTIPTVLQPAAAA